MVQVYMARAGDVLEMSVVECVTCVSVWLVAGWEMLGAGLGSGFTNSGGTRGKWDMCLCFGCGGVGGVGREWVGGLGQGLGGWGVVMTVCVVSTESLY